MKLVVLIVTIVAVWQGQQDGLQNVSAELRRVSLEGHCQQNICSGIQIKWKDFVILSQTSIERQIILTFINSTIAKIPHLMFDTFPDLQVLRMENCSVEAFEKPQFEGASNLIHLYLAHNLIKEIPKNIFLGTDNLQTLHLDHNQITSLHNSSFHALKKLKELSLADNNLQILPLGVFAPMKKLLDLNLAGNRLMAFPRGIFDKNLNLTRLNLARNHFKVFESELLKFQPRMKALDLSGNILQELTLNFELLETIIANDCDLRRLTVFGFIYELELKNNSFRDFPHIPHAINVTSLDMAKNPLGSLSDHPLKRYTRLERLNISSCNLHDIPEDLFKKQSHLKHLDISSNSISTLKFSLFASLDALEYFHFQQNNWNCDFLQLLMNSFVKRKEISFMEDVTAPELVDDFIDGIACWYETNKNSKRCDSDGGSEAALEVAIVRNEIKSFFEQVDKKFQRVYRMLDELKHRL